MIEGNNLVKEYSRKGKEGKSKIKAVDGLNIKIEEGENYGLIGPNGAGKTTTLKMMSGLIIPDGGSIIIDGYEVQNGHDVIKNKIGVVVGEFTRRLYFRLTGRKNLRFFAKLKGMWNTEDRIDELIERFGLEDWQDELYMKYSTGMKHKLSLAVALINDPPILFLDEPLTGIDPKTKHNLKQFVKDELSDKTIIWASHNLYEIEEMCDRIGLLSGGKKVLEGNPNELKDGHWDFEEVNIITSDPERLCEFNGSYLKDGTVIIETKNVHETISEVVEFCQSEGINIQDIRTRKPSLEEIVIEAI